MTASESYIAGLEIESRAEMLHSLLEIMRLSLSDAEDDDMDKCLLLAGELAGNINLIQRQVLESSQAKGETNNEG
ncbi:hypothetical protein IFU23_13930 [Pantoea agglomerans]|uniref:hypothetical protein n=1 Tax=Enterobacter agglomerans TaxID=549 RepID=UPI0017809D29|nr:hypothetical protein [Pantoea agglomerans]MBD8159200.1 hypothetical protein [Pantoea agglomerans]MBD8230282.1 hypothetical protein [Pantoea agglomerans]